MPGQTQLKRKLRKLLPQVSIYVAALVVFLVLMFPVYSVVRASLMSRTEIYTRPIHWFPESLYWHNYVTVMQPDHPVPVRSAILNSFIVSIVTAILDIVLASMAAYAFGRLRFRFKGVILSSLMIIYLLPGMLFLIPMFMIMRALKLWDTYLSLIIPYTTWNLPFMILLCRAFLDSVSVELEEAAFVDGCSRLQAIRHIVLPLMAPGLVAAGVSAFILSWNEFLTPLILTSKLTVVTTVLGMYSTSFETEIGQMAAAGIYSIIPVVILTLVLQKQIVRGITAGALKG